MRSILACGVAAFTATVTPAQLEPGWGVYSRLHNVVNATAAAVPGGVVIYHPYLGQNAYVTGLPDTLTGAYISSVSSGANAVLVRDDDGSLLVSAIYRGVPAEIFDITLDGTAATVRRTYPIGAAVPFSSIDQMAWLPGNRVLFSHVSVANPALEPQGLGVLDLTTGDVTAVPIAGFPAGRTINCVALDPTRTRAYIGTFGGGGGIYSVPVTGGTAVPVPGYETLPSACLQLAVDHDGLLYLGPGFGIGACLQIDPATGATVTVATLNGTVNGVAIEPVTGDVLLARINAGAGTSAMFAWSAATDLVGVPGMSGFESPSGIAVRSSLIPFGTASPRSNQEWQIRPNPGGAPRIGNLGFSLTTSSPQPSLGVMVLAAARAGAPMSNRLAQNVLLDLTTVVQVVALVPPATTFTVDVPLPATLAGGDLHAQVFTMATGVPPLAGGEGLRIHVYD